MVVSAFAIDLEPLLSERRQDQESTDAGVLGGALDLPLGVDAAAEKAASIIRNNLETSHTDDEWEDLWVNCAGNDANLTACLLAYALGSGYDPLFDYDDPSDGDMRPDLEDSVRFAVVPQFHETAFPTGNGWFRIREFRRIYLNDIYFGCDGSGNYSVVFEPGEGTSNLALPNGAGASIDQVTGHLLPNEALPDDLRSDDEGVPEIRLSR